MTSYDVIYTTFLSRTKVDDIDLPNTPEKIYDVIHGAILDFNNRLQDNLKYDDNLEQIDRELTNDELLILAHFLRINFLRNQLIYFSNTWQPFQKDIGLKNFSVQLKSLEYLVESEERIIDSLIANQSEDYL